MTSKKTTPPASDDINRQSFLPIQLDLVDRLTREAEALAAKAAALAERTDKARHIAA